MTAPPDAPARVRFRPPEVEIDATTAWVLARAFGPIEAELAQPPDPAAAIDCARRLDLAARIGSRTPVATLQRDVGVERARTFFIASAMAAALNARLLAVARQIAELAEVAHAPIAFLKGTALLASGIVRDDARSLCDVDVLVRDTDAPALIQRLREAGFASADFPPTEYHFPPLTRGTAEMIEVHLRVLGVRAHAGSAWVGLDDLLALGHLSPLPGWPATAHTPSAAFLRVHALTHGLAQHGLAPDKYPMARMFCDLVDLATAETTEPPSPAHALASDARPTEAAAALALCESLRAGTAAGIGSPIAAGSAAANPDQQALLHHLVVGASDLRYGAALRLRALFDAPTDLSPARHWSRMITQTVFPSRGSLAAIYGPQRSTFGYGLLRVWRPFDLVLRTIRYSALALCARLWNRPSADLGSDRHLTGAQREDQPRKGANPPAR